VLLAGVRGFGAAHLVNIRRLEALGRIRPLAIVDPVLVAERVAAGPASAERYDNLPLFATFADAVAAVGVPDVVVASAPIHAHFGIASEALLAGSDVLLEKPPLARLADFQALRALERDTGRCVQVGFQSLGSHALTQIANDAWHIGPVLHVRAMGAWVRPRRYWTRSAWAGRRTLNGTDVTDGAVTNPFAHAVATALRVAGLDRASDIDHVDVDAYRTNPIESDDTTSLRVVPARKAPTVSAAFTLAGAADGSPGEDPPPIVEIVGERGSIQFLYTLDQVVDATGAVTTAARTDLLENLLDHRANGEPLLVPLDATGAFMRLVEAVRTAPEPTRVEDRYITMTGTGGDAHPVLQDVEHWIRAAADIDGTFAEAGAPWAHAGRDRALAALGASATGGPLTVLLDGGGTTPACSPRPFLYPIRSRAGVDVAARRPPDHDWHLGLGYAFADVDGVNFWGGNTFVPGSGYRMLDDHGHIETASVHSDEGRVLLNLRWIAPDGSVLLKERRTIRAFIIDGGIWVLSAQSELWSQTGRPVVLGGPGTNGRPGAGYGGWFWRLPQCEDVDIRAPETTGESAVHGTVAPWLAWSARFTASQETSGEATLVVMPTGGSEQDPWFLRSAEYPAIGLAPTWSERQIVAPGRMFSRGLLAVIADGRRDPEALIEAGKGVSSDASVGAF
jgi:predicted dehydrogenase